jgi:hypothetical protein
MSNDRPAEEECRVERAADRRIEKLCRSCVAATECDCAAVTMVSTRGDAVRLLATDAMAATLEDLQLTLGEGPCIDAANSGTPVLADDLKHAATGPASQWSAFATEATAAGVQSVFAFPVRIGAIRLGSFALYRRLPAPLSETALSAALDSVDTLGWLLLDLRPDVEPHGQGTGGRYDAVVHQAAGMLKVQLDVPIADALARLRAAAFGEGLAIDDLAQQVVGRQRRFLRDSI